MKEDDKMNELTINNHVVLIKEYNGYRVVTFKDIDTVHERPDGTARKRFNDNRKHFIEDVDYFVRKTDEALNEFGVVAPNGLTLITESGYLMLVKSFTDDLAWEVQRQLVNNYFRMQDVMEQQYKPTRPLTTDDYTEAAKTIAKCHNSRLPIVLDLYRKAGLDIESIHQVQEQRMVEVVEDDVDLVELLQQYTLGELCKLLNLAKSSVYYYRTGRVKPHKKRKEFIIQTLAQRR